jgi:Arc/MetJ family transcription regulator
MRTNIVIDDQLISVAVQVGNFKTKKDAAQPALGGREYACD